MEAENLILVETPIHTLQEQMLILKQNNTPIT